MICPNCGEYNPDGARFCGSCGNALHAPTNTSATANPQAAPTGVPPMPTVAAPTQPRKSKLPLIIGLCALVAVAVAGAVFFGLSGGSVLPQNDDKGEETAPSSPFAGAWRLAAAETDGVTVVGDLGSMLGDEANISITLAEDGSGTASLADENVDLTWESNGDDITISAEDADDVEGTLEDGVLRLESDGDTLMFTATGTIEGIDEISPADASTITTKTPVVGTWQLAGMSMMGVSLYGDSSDLADMVGSTDSAELVLKIDGTGSFDGESVSWALTSDGAALVVEDENVPLKKYRDGILVDMSDVAGLEVTLYYTK